VPPPSPDLVLPLVLIVDDNERNRRLARDVLRADGLRTLEAATGRDAIALAAEQLPDVILLDLRIPDIDGMDVARALRNDTRTAGIPLVALSAVRAGEELGLDEAGFVGFVEKPIRVDRFPAEVRRYARTSA
jgi:two-component system cell cycle response regulator DivK